MSFGPKNENDLDQEVMAEINMTPLIDIMLVLLIIFMVTSSISLESGLDIDIPKTSSSTAKQPSEAVIVSLDQQGKMFVQGKAVELDSIGEAISKALKDEKTTLVVFEGDQKATLGRAIEIMDIAKNAGAVKFAIATESN